jgi:hypothetical protein
MKRILIWWHRRRAIAHAAKANKHRAHGEYGKMNYRSTWAEYHHQIYKRLTQ